MLRNLRFELVTGPPSLLWLESSHFWGKGPYRFTVFCACTESCSPLPYSTKLILAYFWWLAHLYETMKPSQKVDILKKNSKSWDKLPTSTDAGFLPSTASTWFATTFPHHFRSVTQQHLDSRPPQRPEKGAASMIWGAVVAAVVVEVVIVLVVVVSSWCK